MKDKMNERGTHPIVELELDWSLPIAKKNWSLRNKSLMWRVKKFLLVFLKTKKRETPSYTKTTHWLEVEAVKAVDELVTAKIIVSKLKEEEKNVQN